MTRAEVQRQALQLPEQDRLRLAEELWASLEEPNASPADLPIPQWQADLLDQRIEETKDDPGTPWEEVKARIWPQQGSCGCCQLEEF
jgi:putative addiction module component (TIGR02574 family)